MVNLFTIPCDRTTDRVIEYLQYLSNEEIQRINSDESFTNIKISLGNNNSFIELGSKNGNCIKLQKKRGDKGWFRRGSIVFELPVEETNLNIPILKHLNREIEFLTDFLYSYSINLGDRSKEINNNRIKNFLLAEESGLKIPNTIITTSKIELREFKNTFHKIITKPIHNGYFQFKHNDKIYSCLGTVLLSDLDISNLDENFCPSLFQEYVEKEVELRIFFMNGKLYPMAIFSQLDSQTQYDFRNYNHSKPNRNVPFHLDKEIENKLVKFMSEIGLDTGSIDMIYTPEKDYYFLEVNPTGQYGWLSDNCNYYIDREIAKTLIYHEIGKTTCILSNDEIQIGN